MKKRFFTLISVMCMAIVSAFAQSATAERFFTSLTGHSQNGTPVTTNFTVYEDFHFVANLPAPKGGNPVVVGADHATLFVRLTNTPSLGVPGTKTYTHETYTGVEGVYVDLQEMESNLYNFKGITIPLTVRDDDGQDVFTYTVSGTTADYQIFGTPDSYDNAHAAWTRYTSHFTTGNGDGDSRLLLKSGAYMQLGTDKITFNADANLLEEDGTLGKTINTLTNSTTLEENAVSGTASYKAVFFIPAGSMLDLDGTYAILNDDCTVTFDLSKLNGLGENLNMGLAQMLEQVKNANDDSQKRYKFVLLSMSLLNNLVGLVGQAGEVPTLVDFTKEKPILTVYPASADALYEQTVSQFIEIRKTIPNAVAFTTPENADAVEGVDNVIIEYPAGKKGFVRECENFILTDAKDFYTPEDFTAFAGTYSRVSNAAKYQTENGEPNYNSFCLPFAFSASELSSTASILTFSFYEEKDGDRNAYFNTKTEIEAGIPCVVADVAATWNDIEFNNTWIVANSVKANNMQGTYVVTDEFGGSKYYSVVGAENKFGPLKSVLGPFRSCLSLEEGVIIPTDSKSQYINIIVLDPTAINEVSADRNENAAIYNIAGQKVNKNFVPGIYVKNGKKFIVK